MKKLLSLLLLVGITAFIACKGELGPAGPSGQDGTDGIDGTDGTDGQDGNANVKSYTTTISAANWVPFTADLSYIDLQVPILTEEIAATGMVMVYLQEAGNEWYALPFSRGTQSYFFWVKPGFARIHTQNDSTAPTKFAGKVRIVAASSDGRARHPDLDWTNYQEVKNRLQLPD